ncbi:MAG: serine/threonine-protein kinase [Gemmatimonadota bacterium]|nr:serine/threonine-protein kinase [Gemmatimonadota bacterium]
MSDQKICPTCGSEYPLSERFCPRDGTALRSASASADLMGSVVADRYHILKKLGEGGMGQVYLAEHVKMGRKSALKVMNPGMNQDADAIARFNREASNASRLNHPNICAIYDFGETPDGLIYLAMEFIEGMSLTALVEKSGALPPARAASIIHQSADALQVAHDAGIVHRDLKPDNIMIAKNRDGTDLAKVVDFGIAKAHSSDAQKVTKTGMVVGTPEYMSPEQLSGDKLDGRSDIYSLALVAFNCLTGKLPFPGESAQEAMIARLIEQPKTLAEMRPDVAWPADVQAVMDKALARDATERYQSAAQFGRELWAACESMPASQAAEAGTQVLSAPAATAAAASVPKTRVATPGEGGKTVAAPAAKAAPAAAEPAAVPAKKANTGLIAAAVIGIAVLGGGGYLMMGGNGSTPAGGDSTAVAQGPAGPATAAPAPAAPAGGSVAAPAVTPMSTPVNPGNGGGRMPNTAPQSAAAPGGAPAASGGAALVAKWMPMAFDLTAGAAQQILRDVEPEIPSLSGETKGNAYLLVAMAYFKTNNSDDGCAMAERAKPLLKGLTRDQLQPFLEACK